MLIPQLSSGNGYLISSPIVERIGQVLKKYKFHPDVQYHAIGVMYALAKRLPVDGPTPLSPMQKTHMTKVLTEYERGGLRKRILDIAINFETEYPDLLQVAEFIESRMKQQSKSSVKLPKSRK